jgi:hypothetical protein
MIDFAFQPEHGSIENPVRFYEFPTDRPPERHWDSPDRAHLGPVVQSVGLKALLVHHSSNRKHPAHEVGWRRIPIEIDDLISSGPGTAHVLYQGTLEPRKVCTHAHSGAEHSHER